MCAVWHGSGEQWQAKDVLDEAGAKYVVVELDQKNDVPTGEDIQSALATKTGTGTAIVSAVGCSQPRLTTVFGCHDCR